MVELITGAVNHDGKSLDGANVLILGVAFKRDIDDARLSNLIEAISAKRLGLTDVEGDIIGRSYEYLIRKFAEGGGQSAGEFYTPGEVGEIMALIMVPQPGCEPHGQLSIYDPTCGSAGLLIKCEVAYEHLQGARFRHGATFRRWRPDRDPSSCTYAQLEAVVPAELAAIFLP